LSPPAVTPPWTRPSGQFTGNYHGTDLFVALIWFDGWMYAFVLPGWNVNESWPSRITMEEWS
jgi:hypothetical protein